MLLFQGAKVRNIFVKRKRFFAFYLFISEKSRNFAPVIELERHIEILLLDNDCVIIPNLGGFMAHHIDARFDAGDGMFLPPIRTIGFNPQLKLNDSLLIQSYIEAYDISYPEAQRRIEAEVAELRQHLETEGRYELNDIGELRLNSEGHLEFEPCEAGILTPSLYGLSSFEMTPLQVEEQVEQPTEDSADTSTDTEQETVDEPKTEHAITIKMSWLRNSVAVVAAVILFLVIGTPFSNSYLADSSVQQSTIIPLPTNAKTATAQTLDTLTAAATADSAATEVAVEEQTAQKQIAEEQTAEEQAAEEQVAEKQAAEALPQPTTDYRLVLASWVAQRNAEIFVNQLKEDGFSEAHLYRTPNMLRVVYGHYATETDAYNALHQLRAKSKHFAEAWVLKVRSEK